MLILYILSLTFYLHHILVLCFLIYVLLVLCDVSKLCVDLWPQDSQGFKGLYGLLFLPSRV